MMWLCPSSPSYPTSEKPSALIWKLMIAEKRFSKLDAPHQLSDVCESREFSVGKPLLGQQRKAA